MGVPQPCAVDGVSYHSKSAAIWGLFEQGLAPDVIAEKIGIPRARVVISIADQKRMKGWVAPAEETRWTEAKVDTAVRLFTACLEEVARHLDVPSAELRDLWVKGRQPKLPMPEPEEAPAPEDEPDREDDEAELARLAAEDDVSEPAPQEVPAAPVSRFPDPAPAKADGPAPRLIPPGGIFPAGHEVRLIRADGKYLHESLQDFTDKAKYAWSGTRLQYDTIKARMPKVVAKLSMEVVV